jgi:hypothetical protein
MSSARGKYTAEIHTDCDDDAQYPKNVSIQKKVVDSASHLKVHLGPGGGLAVLFIPALQQQNREGAGDYRLIYSGFAPLAGDFRACFHSKLEWRNWQTHGTQNPATFTGHVGSTPTSSTIEQDNPSIRLHVQRKRQ